MTQEKIIIIKSRRKTLSLQVKPDLSVVVKAPFKLNQTEIASFVAEKAGWIAKQKAHYEHFSVKLKNVSYFPADKHKYKKAARKYFTQKVESLTAMLNLSFKKVRISGASQRWGSCSSKKFINLNWKLVFAPPEVIDYVILHEVLHLRHMNHSQAFWDDIKSYCPNFKEHKKWLAANSYLLMLK